MFAEIPSSGSRCAGCAARHDDATAGGGRSTSPRTCRQDHRPPRRSNKRLSQSRSSHSCAARPARSDDVPRPPCPQCPERTRGPRCPEFARNLRSLVSMDKITAPQGGGRSGRRRRTFARAIVPLRWSACARPWARATVNPQRPIRPVHHNCGHEPISTQRRPPGSGSTITLRSRLA
jgi:hypothetical protein